MLYIKEHRNYNDVNKIFKEYDELNKLLITDYASAKNDLINALYNNTNDCMIIGIGKLLSVQQNIQTKCTIIESMVAEFEYASTDIQNYDLCISSLTSSSYFVSNDTFAQFKTIFNVMVKNGRYAIKDIDKTVSTITQILSINA